MFSSWCAVFLFNDWPKSSLDSSDRNTLFHIFGDWMYLQTWARLECFFICWLKKTFSLSSHQFKFSYYCHWRAMFSPLVDCYLYSVPWYIQSLGNGCVTLFWLIFINNEILYLFCKLFVVHGCSSWMFFVIYLFSLYFTWLVPLRSQISLPCRGCKFNSDFGDDKLRSPKNKFTSLKEKMSK